MVTLLAGFGILMSIHSHRKLFAALMTYRFAAGIVLLLFIHEFGLRRLISTVLTWTRSLRPWSSSTITTARRCAIFSGRRRRKTPIIDQISKPAEKTLTWAEYRPIFMTKERVNAGAKFWGEHREALEDIETRSGVPIEILVGIIGVEDVLRTHHGWAPRSRRTDDTRFLLSAALEILSR